VTIKNSPDTDVLAQRPESEHLIAIQAKTSSRGMRFLLSESNERPSVRDGQWFVFVGDVVDYEDRWDLLTTETREVPFLATG
jgi:hypothetical protein